MTNPNVPNGNDYNGPCFNGNNCDNSGDCDYCDINNPPPEVENIPEDIQVIMDNDYHYTTDEN